MGMVDFELGDVGDIFTSIREAWTGDKIKDPVEMAKIELKMMKIEQAINLGQISINKAEAMHKSLFVAGWRPFIGWTCGIAIAYAFIGQPIIEWIVSIKGLEIKPPQIDSGVLFELVLAMLGMAGLRTYEKKNNVAREK